MNQDQIERDRLLTEVHSDMKHLLEWAKHHDDNDKNNFDTMHKRIKHLEDDRLKMIGGASVLGAICGLFTKWIFK